ncbi:MAG: hypothetical protein J1E31_03195 [Helicobacter sp.]|nr:hypothetical protein [Helicobacter sp.]
MQTKIITKLTITLSLAVCVSVTSVFAAGYDLQAAGKAAKKNLTEFNPSIPISDEVKAMYPDIEAYKKDEAQWLERCEKASREILKETAKVGVEKMGEEWETNEIFKEYHPTMRDCIALAKWLRELNDGYYNEAQALRDVIPNSIKFK